MTCWAQMAENVAESLSQGRPRGGHRPPRAALLGDPGRRQALEGRDHRRRDRAEPALGHRTVLKNERREGGGQQGGGGGGGCAGGAGDRWGLRTRRGALLDGHARCGARTRTTPAAARRRSASLTQEQVDYVDYKDVNLLRRFMSDRAKIRARRVTGNDAQQQRRWPAPSRTRGDGAAALHPADHHPARHARSRIGSPGRCAHAPPQRRRRPQPLVGPRARRVCPMSWWATAWASESVAPDAPLYLRTHLPPAKTRPARRRSTVMRPHDEAGLMRLILRVRRRWPRAPGRHRRCRRRLRPQLPRARGLAMQATKGPSARRRRWPRPPSRTPRSGPRPSRSRPGCDRCITVPWFRKAGPEGKLFGSVTAADVTRARPDRHRVDRRRRARRADQGSGRGGGSRPPAPRGRVPVPVEVVQVVAESPVPWLRRTPLLEWGRDVHPPGHTNPQRFSPCERIPVRDAAGETDTLARGVLPRRTSTGGCRPTTSRPRSRCSAPCSCRATPSPRRCKWAAADDFYKPAHGHVFDAITSLYGGASRPTRSPSPRSCSRAGLLDAIGGPAVLVTLQAVDAGHLQRPPLRPHRRGARPAPSAHRGGGRDRRARLRRPR